MDTSKMDWIHGIWFVPGNEQDFLGTMFRAEGKWVFHFRFRYYNPESTDPYDGKDTKRQFAYKTKDNTDAEKHRMLQVIGETIRMIEARYQTKADFVALDCHPENPKFTFEVGSRDWIHMKLDPQGA